MTENCSQRPVSAMAMSPWLWWTGLFLLLALGPTSAVLSQEFPPSGPQYFSTMSDAVADSYEAESGFLYSDAFTGRTGQSFGAMIRGGYLTGPTVGREKGIAPLEMMPYIFFGDGMFFADIRGFRGDRGDFGANLGLGYRQYIAPLNRIFGANFFYDIDNTTGYTFNQLGFGIETLGELFDARANAYFPYGDRDIFLGTVLVDGTQHFVGHQLLYNVQNAFLNTLLGADAEIGFLLPGAFAARHDLRIFGGGYHYETNDNVKFAGGSARLQGNPIPSVQLQLQVTHDDVFATNVMFGAQISWGGFRPEDNERPSQFARMTTPIQRQYTISTTKTYSIDENVVAINQSTGQPYFFNHVASATSILDNGQEVAYNTDPFAVRDGTVEHPFLSINESETRNPSRPGDIVFVHADSQYDEETVALKPGLEAPNGTQELSIRYLGNGTNDFNIAKFEVSHVITVPGIGAVVLPTRNDGPGQTPIYNINEPLAEQGDRPLFTNGIGDGVTLANFAEFSGFQVGDEDVPNSGPTGHGAFGTDVESVQLNQNIFAYADGDGIRLENVLDNINIIDTNIINPDGIGLRIVGGSPEITFGASDPRNLDLGLIQNQPANGVPGLSLLITDTDPGAEINLRDSTILNGVSGNGSATGGIQILRASGIIGIGRATITSPEAPAIVVDSSPGNVTFFRQLDILERESIGINLLNNSGQIFFDATSTNGVPDGGVNITWDGAGSGAAISWQGNSGTTTFDSDVLITIQGSGGDGINLGTLVGNTGSFAASGGARIEANDDGPGFNIQGVGIHVSNNTGNVVFNRSGGSATTIINDRAQRGILVDNNGGLVRFFGTTVVENDAASLLPAVEIHDNVAVDGRVRFARLDVNNALQDLDLDFRGAGLVVYDNPALVEVDAFNATGTSGISLYAFNVGDDSDPDNPLDGLVINSGEIIGNTDLPAIDIQQSVYGVALDQVNSADSARQGILLLNNTNRAGATWGFQVLNTQIIADPLAGLSGSGGTIEGAAFDGIHAENTGTVSLNYMVIDGSGGAGVSSILNEELEMLGNEVIENAGDGVFALNTLLITIAGDPDEAGVINFDSNGTIDGFDHQVHLVSTEVETDQSIDNEWTIVNTEMIHNLASAAILVENPRAGNGDPVGHSHLLFVQRDNIITLEAPGTDVDLSPTQANLDPEFDPLDPTDTHRTAMGTFVLWNGTIDTNSEITGNQISYPEGGAIGIAVRATSDDDADQIILDISNNVLTGNNGNTLGIYFDSEFTNSTLLNISGNTINLTGFGGSDVTNESFEIGILIDSLDRQSEVTIANNSGTIISDNSFAVAFNRVNSWGDFRGLTRAPGTYNISGNQFTMQAINAIDNDVTGFSLGTPVGGTVNLNSVTENTINFVNTTTGLLVDPPTSNAFDGQINVNGQLFPQ